MMRQDRSAYTRGPAPSGLSVSRLSYREFENQLLKLILVKKKILNLFNRDKQTRLIIKIILKKYTELLKKKKMQENCK